MLSNEAQLARLKDKKANIEEALFHTNYALNHDDYRLPFEFKNPNTITPDQFQQENLRQIADVVERRQLGFDPDLVLQHIEAEVLDQFNDIVKMVLKGKAIPTLMQMKHELELFCLKDRKEGHTKSLEETNKAILALTEMMAPKEPATPVEAKSVVEDVKKFQEEHKATDVHGTVYVPCPDPENLAKVEQISKARSRSKKQEAH